MPLTQEQISEALGITPVHANRIIRQLRDDGIVDINRGRVAVLDEAKLAELAQFDDRYLHQDPSAREVSPCRASDACNGDLFIVEERFVFGKIMQVCPRDRHIKLPSGCRLHPRCQGVLAAAPFGHEPS